MEQETAWTEHPHDRHARCIGHLCVNVTPTRWPARPWRFRVEGPGVSEGGMAGTLHGAKCGGTREARRILDADGE